MYYIRVCNKKVQKLGNKKKRSSNRGWHNTYGSTTPAPATETLLPKRDFFGRGAEADASSMVRLRFVALRVPPFLLLVSTTSSSFSFSFLLGLYAAASGWSDLRLLRVVGRPLGVCSFSSCASRSSVAGVPSNVLSADAFSRRTSSEIRL